MASKNASLGALDALRTKVRDKSDINDKKKVKDAAPVSKKDEGKQDQHEDKIIKTVDSSKKKNSIKSQQVNNASDPKVVDSKNNSTSRDSIEAVKTGNDDYKDTVHESTTAAPAPATNKKKKAGRKKIADNKKRVQITLTISHSANDRLTEWASDMPKSGSRLLSDYIDYHLEDIIDYYNKIL